MSSMRLGRQPDLFATPGDLFDPRQEAVEPPPADFIDRIRRELTETLSFVAAAQSLPWQDPTRAILTELRFNSIVNWLPTEEAQALRSAFAVELDRLYAQSPAE